eukprot:CAMPEP_0170093422 /NCGR_PEP_ID=MMETSP0019_2-20121128/26505_1 /TAXON_ID=98059 /ORGANISM="Dinobryon sp., Strain UTEXLB2267" /LENGTH=196 /DNA_ID=CAMNT_0010314267 /DNA_START=868 /DNA_END=1460 /DNA_ORIENTATION=-
MKDIEVGGEFNAAVDEARKWKIPVLLGDRDIDVTLQRLLCALCGQDSLRMKETFSKLAEKTGTATLSSDSATKEELQIAAEKLKRNASLLYMAMKEELPDIFAALVEERDLLSLWLLLLEELQIAAEKLKRNASLLYMAMKEELPDIFAALVEERDLFMTEAILQSNSQVLVAVVGKGHLPGIQRNLDELGGYKSI